MMPPPAICSACWCGDAPITPDPAASSQRFGGRTACRASGGSRCWRESKSALYVESISVSATARGRGVGSALLARAHQLAIDSRLRCVELEVVDTNPRAHALYARLGYADVKHSRMPWPLSRWICIKATTLMRLDVGDGQSTI
jgi:GNAT superfamily N-acetyltransferase